MQHAAYQYVFRFLQQIDQFEITKTWYQSKLEIKIVQSLTNNHAIISVIYSSLPQHPKASPHDLYRKTLVTAHKTARHLDMASLCM